LVHHKTKYAYEEMKYKEDSLSDIKEHLVLRDDISQTKVEMLIPCRTEKNLRSRHKFQNFGDLVDSEMHESFKIYGKKE
jgi:hypothetical protein